MRWLYFQVGCFLSFDLCSFYISNKNTVYKECKCLYAIDDETYPRDEINAAEYSQLPLEKIANLWQQWTEKNKIAGRMHQLSCNGICWHVNNSKTLDLLRFDLPKCLQNSSRQKSQPNTKQHNFSTNLALRRTRSGRITRAFVNATKICENNELYHADWYLCKAIDQEFWDFVDPCPEPVPGPPSFLKFLFTEKIWCVYVHDKFILVLSKELELFIFDEAGYFWRRLQLNMKQLSQNWTDLTMVYVNDALWFLVNNEQTICSSSLQKRFSCTLDLLHSIFFNFLPPYKLNKMKRLIHDFTKTCANFYTISGIKKLFLKNVLADTTIRIQKTLIYKILGINVGIL
ncbi:hypothetical protein RFI_06540 [Reticulomyxa filosa]|uniref:Uncharacterized protein n=1 Tax=Reticulomyxa filosa TaxID=46433 RepID=X6NX43_RETFI|nr:hypothetical protein RFI_06540 [Reticulomyxa filosa]|eukprot:ETO30581.1 hypothetical protein RFI_06540 [Reticulomyxa filosa]